jgi:alanyl-tRNA synthetase
MFRGEAEVDQAYDGDEVEVYLDQTPMYAEGGGQVGDIGVIEGPLGTIEVRDVQRQGQAHAHYGVIASGDLSVGEQVQVEVDPEARWATMRHHSATHLVHKALRTVLGESATQAGSYVAPDTCTFDFNLDRAVSADEMDAIFRIVNRAVRDDLPKTTDVMALEDARRSGAMMLFGEKYADVVRVVSFGQFSTELCGGTHVERTGQIGIVAPVAEKSVGAGLRRVEFLAGERAESHLREIQNAAEEAARALRVGLADLPDRVEALVEERKRLQKEIDDLRLRSVEGNGKVPGHGFADGIAYQLVSSDDADFIRSVADRLLDAESTAQAALVMGQTGDEGRVVVKTRRGANLSANDGFGRIRAAVGGKGGGNEVLAQGGGFSAAEFDRVVEALKAWIIESGAAKDTA